MSFQTFSKFYQITDEFCVLDNRFDAPYRVRQLYMDQIQLKVIGFSNTKCLTFFRHFHFFKNFLAFEITNTVVFWEIRKEWHSNLPLSVQNLFPIDLDPVPEYFSHPEYDLASTIQMLPDFLGNVFMQYRNEMLNGAKEKTTDKEKSLALLCKFFLFNHLF